MQSLDCSVAINYKFQLSSKPILGCLVWYLMFSWSALANQDSLVRDIRRISLPAVIYSLLYASVQRLYLPSVDHSSHYLSDIYFCMRFSRYVMFARLWVSRNGDGEIRTLDPLLARQVLSQLSYTPIPGNIKFSDRPLLRSMGLSGPYLLDSDYPKQM